MKPFRARAMAVVGSFIGFYALGAALVGGLLAIPLTQWAVRRPDLGGMLALGLAGLVAFAMLPRMTRRANFGIALDRGRHERLHAFVADLARRADQPAPERLYVLPESNAFTTNERRGYELRAHPIVGLGLPLLLTFDEQELASVIVHELGHHHAGDVRLGPFVHRTRGAIADAVDRLEGMAAFLRLPFMLYGSWFLRLSMPLGREQELHADDLAREVVGPGPTASALDRVEWVALRWSAYFHGEVVPVVDRGFMPPVVAGFRTFLANFEAKALKLEDESSKRRTTSPYDTHPSTEERVRRLGGCEGYVRGPLAVGLIDDVHDLESVAVRSILKPGVTLAPIHWEDVTDRIWLPTLREHVALHRDVAARLHVQDLRQHVAELDAIAESLRLAIRTTSPKARKQRARLWLLNWFTVALVDRGLTLEITPGAPMRVVGPNGAFEPEATIDDLIADRMSRDAYHALLATHGIA